MLAKGMTWRTGRCRSRRVFEWVVHDQDHWSLARFYFVFSFSSTHIHCTMHQSGLVQLREK